MMRNVRLMCIYMKLHSELMAPVRMTPCAATLGVFYAAAVRVVRPPPHFTRLTRCRLQQRHGQPGWCSTHPHRDMIYIPRFTPLAAPASSSTCTSTCTSTSTSTSTAFAFPLETAFSSSGALRTHPPARCQRASLAPLSLPATHLLRLTPPRLWPSPCRPSLWAAAATPRGPGTAPVPPVGLACQRCSSWTHMGCGVFCLGCALVGLMPTEPCHAHDSAREHTCCSVACSSAARSAARLIWQVGHSHESRLPTRDLLGMHARWNSCAPSPAPTPDAGSETCWW